VTDETPNPTAPETDRPVEPGPGRAPRPVEPRPARPPLPGHAPLPPPVRGPSSADTSPRRPEYRGEELDPERGPGLGCFWFQVIVLGFFIVIIPVGLNLNWPFELLAILLFVVIGLLLLTGQTVIFLLRLVAADRRAQGRRRPLASTTKTVGQLEDEAGAQATIEEAGAQATIEEAGAQATTEEVGAQATTEEAGAQATTEREAPAPAADDPAAHPAADPATPDAVVVDDAVTTVDEAARDAAGVEVPASDSAPAADAPPADAADAPPADAADAPPADAADAPPADATGPEEPDPGVRQ